MDCPFLFLKNLQKIVSLRLKNQKGIPKKATNYEFRTKS